MNLADAGNAFFEGGLALLLTLNIKRLRKDKKVQGASLIPSIFVTLWGYWNMYYYPHLGQSLSFYCGAAVSVMNTAWLILVMKYKYQTDKILQRNNVAWLKELTEITKSGKTRFTEYKMNDGSVRRVENDF